MRQVKLFSLIFFALVLAACQNDEEAKRLDVSMEETEEVEAEETVEEENPHEGKETKKVSEIEKNELYRWEIDSDKVVVLSEKTGEIQENDAPSMIGEEGDQLFDGVAELYLVYEGHEEGYLEDSVELYLLNLDRPFADSYPFGEGVILDLFQSESSNLRSHRTWYFSNEQLHRISFESERELISTNSKLKFIEDTYMQSFSYDNAGMGEYGLGWHFHTWEWDSEEFTFTNVAHKAYTDDEEFGWETGELMVEEWNEYEDFYIPFPQLTLTKKDIKLIEKGSLMDKSIKLGDSVDKLKHQHEGETDYLLEDYYNGAALISYSPQFSYLYDEGDKEIVSILLAGDALTNDVASIRELLGEPTVSEFSEMESLHFEQFTIENNVLTMYYDENKILSLEISPKPKKE